MSRNDLIDIACTLHADPDTAMAILVSLDDDEDNAVWLPRSQIEYVTNHKTGVTVVTMPEWLAMERGLI